MIAGESIGEKKQAVCSLFYTFTPVIRRSIQKARQESARGETIVCRTPEEMQKYFDSL